MSDPSEQPSKGPNDPLVTRLREENQRLSAFAHDVAHDLRSPVRRLRTFAQLVEERLSDESADVEEIRSFLERSIACAYEIDERVCSILDERISPS